MSSDGFIKKKLYRSGLKFPILPGFPPPAPVGTGIGRRGDRLRGSSVFREKTEQIQPKNSNLIRIISR